MLPRCLTEILETVVSMDQDTMQAQLYDEHETLDKYVPLKIVGMTTLVDDAPLGSMVVSAVDRDLFGERW